MIGDRRLDLSLLERALAQLRLALAEHAAEPDKRAFRDSVVMHFLFTYELAAQVIKRFVQLEHIKSSSTPESELSFPKIVRRADDLGVLKSGWDEFATFRDARNTVAHTYSEAKANSVVTIAAKFADEAQYLLDRVKVKIDG